MKKKLTLKEIQSEELNILKYVVNILEENDLKYSLVGGTLLGAIRHKGFIPWDDDIDIGMPRPDYDKFINLFDKVNKKNNIELQAYEKGNSFIPFCKIVNTDILIKDDSICDQEKRFLWVDIFPQDAFGDDEKETSKMFEKIEIYKKLIYIHHYKNKITKNSNLIKFVKRLILKPIAMFITADTITQYAKKENYNNASYIGNIVWGYGKNERIPKSYFDNLIEVEFENSKFKAYKSYDEYLKQIYGEYMKLPPKEKRVTHNIKAWRV